MLENFWILAAIVGALAVGGVLGLASLLLLAIETWSEGW
jgi:hypothetical protein